MPRLVKYNAYLGPRGELKKFAVTMAWSAAGYPVGRLINIWLTNKLEKYDA